MSSSDAHWLLPSCVGPELGAAVGLAFGAGGSGTGVPPAPPLRVPESEAALDFEFSPVLPEP